ncbi:MAG: DUF222 domain-containing protein [Geodermatophilaceae bacterium]|nr:DUF222 domain-containing protein [Geodermatophilaceae bacterium]
MSESVAGVVSVEELGEDICRLAASLAAATSRWLLMIAEFDRREGWGGIGVKSCAHWLSWRCGLSPGTGREHVRVARALLALPLIAAAFAAGSLSYSKVRAITRIADQDTEEDLLALALSATAAQVERVVRGWRTAESANAPDQDARRDVSWHWDREGMLIVRARLGPEEGALFLAGLEAARESESESESDATDAQTEQIRADESEMATPTDDADGFPRERPTDPAADALVSLAQTYLDPDPDRRSTAARHQVVVHVDAAVLADDTAAGAAHVENGTALSHAQVRRIACDAALVVLLRDGADVLDVGRKRTIPTRMLQAIWARDRACRFPGCTERRRDRVQAHHIWHWADGGPTSLSNLVLLCRFHHHLVHDDGFGVRRGSDGDLSFTTPSGIPVPEHPTWLRPDETPAPTLAAKEPLAQWDGQRLDLNYAVSVLLSRRSYVHDRRGRKTAA